MRHQDRTTDPDEWEIDAMMAERAADLDEHHCPNCGKPYQPRNVNAADYRIDYDDQLGRSHVCAACWYARPADVPARRVSVDLDTDQTAAGLRLGNAIAAALYGTKGEHRPKS